MQEIFIALATISATFSLLAAAKAASGAKNWNWVASALSLHAAMAWGLSVISQTELSLLSERMVNSVAMYIAYTALVSIAALAAFKDEKTKRSFG